MIAPIRDRHQPSVRRSAAFSLVAMAVLVLLAGCTTRTVGMESPLAHDYDGIQWRPLDAEINQRIIVAPGYTSVVENDPSTGPEQIVQRIDRLPDDVRGSELDEIRLALRPADDREFIPSLEIEVGIAERLDATATFTLDDVEFDGDWVVISDPPAAHAGETLDVRIAPQQGWEYGITPDRVPYGGYPAVAGSEGVQQQSLQGSIGFQTIFNQETDASTIVTDDIAGALRGAATDPVLIVFYAAILIALGSVWVYQRKKLEVT